MGPSCIADPMIELRGNPSDQAPVHVFDLVKKRPPVNTNFTLKGSSLKTYITAIAQCEVM